MNFRKIMPRFNKPAKFLQAEIQLISDETCPFVAIDKNILSIFFTHCPQ